MKFLKKLIDTEYKEMKRYEKLADEIESLEEEYSKKTDEELKAMTSFFKEELKNGKTLDDILVHAFATVRSCFSNHWWKTISCTAYWWYGYPYGNIAEWKRVKVKL